MHEPRDELVILREHLRRGGKQDRASEEAVLLGRDGGFHFALLGVLDDGGDATQHRAKLRRGLRSHGASSEAEDEAAKYGKGGGDEDVLAGGDGEEGGEDMEDAGVEVGFDNGGEDGGGVDKGGEGEGEKRNGFRRQGTTVGGSGRVGEIRDVSGENEDYDAGELEELVDVVGKVGGVVFARSVGLSVM